MGQARVVAVIPKEEAVIVRLDAATMTKADWARYAGRFVTMRRGIAGARGDEFAVGYLDGFKAVYAQAFKREGEPWYVWFITPGRGHCERIVTELMPGIYVDHEGTVIEWDPAWMLVVGTVTRVGDEPLLTADMLNKAKAREGEK